MPIPMPDPTPAAPVGRLLADTGADAGALAVVFVHGTRTSSRIWASQQAALSAVGIRSIAVDLPGHGTRIADEFSLAAAATVLDEAIDSLPSGTRVLLVGLSLGGYVALSYAARSDLTAAGSAGAPSRIVGVIATGCSSEPKGKPLRAYRDIARLVDRAGKWLRREPRTVVRGPDERPDWDVVTQVLTALAGTSAIENLRAITVPVWLVSGQHCHLRFEAKRFLRARPDVAAVTIPGAGHDANTDAPDAFNALLLDCVRAIAPARSP